MRRRLEMQYVFRRVRSAAGPMEPDGQIPKELVERPDASHYDHGSGFLTRRPTLLAALVLVLALYATSLMADQQRLYEARAIEPAVAPLSQALTLARVRSHEGEQIVLVVDFESERLLGIPIPELGIHGVSDPIDAAASLKQRPDALARLSEQTVVSYPMKDVMPAGGGSAANIGTASNFAKHADEARMATPFSFPKLGLPGPARTQVLTDTKTQLLDYAVEICVRFDRSLRSLKDFDDAVAGFFLCADFTDRGEMIRRIDLDDPMSGIGFTEAKSGTDYLPTGPFLVVPRDWRLFIANERIVTEVNGQQRQDARGRDMILDFRKLVENVIADAGVARFSGQDASVSLTTEAYSLPRGVILMSGTGEGVVYRRPTRDELSEARFIARYKALDVREGLVEVMLNAERKISTTYLRPGSLVTYRSSTLGEIKVDVAAFTKAK